MSGLRPPRIHYLRTNKGERSPHRLLVIDAESETLPDELRELQILRCWCSRRIIRHGREGRAPRVVDARGQSAEGLADEIERWATGRETLWVFTHNLSYDLVLTRLPLILFARGWSLGRHNLASEAPWALLKRGSHSVRLADSWSWLPVAVKVLGEAMGMGKPELPNAGDPEAVWYRRCQADLEITARAIEGLMDEWDERALGWWSITGPATAWNSMLHMAPEPTRRSRGGARESIDDKRVGAGHRAPVIAPDPEARAFERLALYSGRRDIWRRGKLTEGPYVDLDFRSAHLAVCAAMLLPARRSAHFDELGLDDWHLRAVETDVIARVVVAPKTPRYPLRWQRAVIHPVGEFETVLAGPEIREAKARGELRWVGPGYSYRLGSHMHTWASWAWAVLHDPEARIDPLLRIFIKAASRTVPGRWGMLVSHELRRGPTALEGWSMEPLLVGSPARRGALVRINGEWSEQVRDVEADDSFPAVLAFIQSWVRLLVGRAVDRLGNESMLQCNTDSMLVPAARLAELGGESWGEVVGGDDQGAALSRGLRALSTATAPLEARVKTVSDRVVISSPQHLRLGGERKYSGIPAAAEEIGPETFRFWTWPKLAGQMERGDPRGYIRERRTVNLSGLTVNRWAFACGCCEPVEAAWRPQSGNRLLGPPKACPRHGKALSPSQHRILRPLLG